ncbi:MAG: thioredoxin family protein [Bacteroidota bacterium]
MTRLIIFCIAVCLAGCATHKKTTVQHKAAPKPTAVVKEETAPAPTGMSETGIAWQKSDRLIPVLEEAQKQHKPVFLEFYATWCGPCKVMEREVFSQPDIYDYLNKNFLSYHVDVDSPTGKPIAEIYEIKGMPTVIFVDPKGVALETELGLITASRFKKVADSALAKMKK